MIPGAYNNNVQLLQTPGHVVILNEMIHSARIIPLDGRPHGSVRQWSGDSRGHWEGNTLVVDTVNFKRETSLEGSSANTHLIERFTRAGENTLLYEFTVDDPSTWTKPWSAVIEMSKGEGPIYEYACHEGNYAMEGILSGARKREAQAAKKLARPSSISDSPASLPPKSFPQSGCGPRPCLYYTVVFEQLQRANDRPRSSHAHSIFRLPLQRGKKTCGFIESRTDWLSGSPRIRYIAKRLFGAAAFPRLPHPRRIGIR
jgi:hypothetical protein